MGRATRLPTTIPTTAELFSCDLRMTGPPSGETLEEALAETLDVVVADPAAEDEGADTLMAMEGAGALVSETCDGVYWKLWKYMVVLVIVLYGLFSTTT